MFLKHRTIECLSSVHGCVKIHLEFLYLMELWMCFPSYPLISLLFSHHSNSHSRTNFFPNPQLYQSYSRNKEYPTLSQWSWGLGKEKEQEPWTLRNTLFFFSFSFLFLCFPSFWKAESNWPFFFSFLFFCWSSSLFLLLICLYLLLHFS